MKLHQHNLKLETALLDQLSEHIELLKSCEPTFGHATALLKYGQKFHPRKKPSWLAMGAKRDCFNNATRYALLRNDVCYAEGYAVDPEVPIPVQHAWLVDENGAVIDPTWENTKDHVYFGIAFEKPFVADILAWNADQAGILVNLHLLRRHLRSPEAIEEAIAQSRHMFEVRQTERL